MALNKEIKEKVFKVFRAWEEKNYPDASETSLSDWNIGRYKEVFTMVPSGGKRGNYMYFVKEAYSWGVGEDESRDGLYCGFEGVVGATVIGV